MFSIRRSIYNSSLKPRKLSNDSKSMFYQFLARDFYEEDSINNEISNEDEASLYEKICMKKEGIKLCINKSPITPITPLDMSNLSCEIRKCIILL